MSDELRIVIAEDHPFFRDGLRQTFAALPSMRVVAEAADGMAALEQIRASRPDVAILDIGLPKLDGIAIVRRLREEQISVEIVFLTICDDEGIFEAALELGVKGYLLKDCTESELIRCVAAAASVVHEHVRKAARVARHQVRQ